jgi:PhnB protein
LEITLSPYLNFNGNTADAMKFYQSVFAGELNMQTFGEANMAQSPEQKNLIVHAALKVSDTFSLMASDTLPDHPTKPGENVRLSLSGNDNTRLTEIFNKLSQGGQVEMPLAKQFWGDTFGMLTDRFSIHWMVNIASQQ